MTVLARMDWIKLLDESGVFQHKEDKLGQGERFRNQYLRDYDRLIFSPSFRRLGRKTQVHPLARNDHVHTRLTHSLEVASVGRSLGSAVENLVRDTDRLPEHFQKNDFGTIIQAACLAHDIGNPPFGHAGEFAIRYWFDSNEGLLNENLNNRQLCDLKNFEGNAQGFRIVTQIENHYMNGGLRLSAATLGTLIKYPWFSDSMIGREKKKFNIFSSEEKIYLRLCDKLGLIKIGSGHFCRHPLSYLMEVADDICYRILDIEDALEMSVIRFDDVAGIFEKIVGGRITTDGHQRVSVRRRIMPYRAAAINQIIEAVADVFVQNYELIMCGKYEGDLLSGLSGNIAEGLGDFKSITTNVIFNDPRKVELEVGSYSVMSIILESFISSVNELKSDKGLSFRGDRILKLMAGNQPTKSESYYECYMKVADFVSGMTDNYATYIAGQISGNAK